MEADPATVLEWLQMDSDETRELQLMALEQLCNDVLFSDNVDTFFERYQPLTFLPALCKIFLDDTVPDMVLEADARAITYYLDLSNECSRRVVQVPGAVRAISSRLEIVDMSDPKGNELGQQIIKLLQIICTRESGSVYESGGLTNILNFVNNYSTLLHEDTVLSAMESTAKLCNKSNPSDSDLPSWVKCLSNFLEHQNSTIGDLALKCFSNLVERFNRQGYEPTKVASDELLSQLVARLKKAAGIETSTENRTVTHFSSNQVESLSNLILAFCRGSKQLMSRFLSTEDLDSTLAEMISNQPDLMIGDFFPRLVDTLLMLLFQGHKNISIKKEANKEGSSDTKTENQNEIGKELENFTPMKSISSPISTSSGWKKDVALRSLVEAIRSKDTNIFIDTFENGNFHIDYSDDMGQSLLNWACAFGTTEMVEYLCSRGADVNKGVRSSSLHYAACFGRPDIVRVLLRYNANPNLQDEEGKLPIDKARDKSTDSSHQEVIQILSVADCYRSDNILDTITHKDELLEPEVQMNFLRKLMPVVLNILKDTLNSSVKRNSLSLLRKMTQYANKDLLEIISDIKYQKVIFTYSITQVVFSILTDNDEENMLLSLEMSKELLTKCPGKYVKSFTRLGVLPRIQNVIDATLVSFKNLQAEGQCFIDFQVLAPSGNAVATYTPYTWKEWNIFFSDKCLYIYNNKALLELCIQPITKTSEESGDSPSDDEQFYPIMYKHDCDTNAIVLKADSSNTNCMSPRKFDLLQRFYKEVTNVNSRLIVKNIFSLPTSDIKNVVIFNNVILKKSDDGDILSISLQNSSEKETEYLYFLDGNKGVRLTEKIEEIENFEQLKTKPLRYDSGELKTTIEYDQAVPFWTNNRRNFRRMISHGEFIRSKIHQLALIVFDKLVSKKFVGKTDPEEISEIEINENLLQLQQLAAKIERAHTENDMCALDECYKQLSELLGDEDEMSITAHELIVSQVLSALLNSLCGGKRSDRLRAFKKHFCAIGGPSLVAKCIQALEQLEKLPVYSYTGHINGSGGSHLITRPIKLQLKKGDPSQNALYDRTDKYMRVKPLVTVDELEKYILENTLKQWYDYPRFSYLFKNNTKLHDKEYGGVIYWLGTNGGANKPWINPFVAGLVNIVSSDGYHLPSGSLEMLIANYNSEKPKLMNPGSSCHTSDEEDSWVAIDLGLYINLTGYTMLVSHKDAEMAPRSWVLEGSKDGREWSILKEHKDDKTFYDGTTNSNSNSCHIWNLKRKEDKNSELSGWRYLKIRVTGMNKMKRHHLAVQSIEFFGTVTKIVTDPDEWRAGCQWQRESTEKILVDRQTVRRHTMKHLVIGARVVRGPHWKWSDQDNNGPGKVVSELRSGWVDVHWDCGHKNSYRMGKDQRFDLRLAPPSPPSSTSKHGSGRTKLGGSHTTTGRTLSKDSSKNQSAPSIVETIPPTGSTNADSLTSDSNLPSIGLDDILKRAQSETATSIVTTEGLVEECNSHSECREDQQPLVHCESEFQEIVGQETSGDALHTPNPTEENIHELSLNNDIADDYFFMATAATAEIDDVSEQDSKIAVPTSEESQKVLSESPVTPVLAVETAEQQSNFVSPRSIAAEETVHSKEESVSSIPTPEFVPNVSTNNITLTTPTAKKTISSSVLESTNVIRSSSTDVGLNKSETPHILTDTFLFDFLFRHTASTGEDIKLRDKNKLLLSIINGGGNRSEISWKNILTSEFMRTEHSGDSNSSGSATCGLRKRQLRRMPNTPQNNRSQEEANERNQMNILSRRSKLEEGLFLSSDDYCSGEFIRELEETGAIETIEDDDDDEDEEDDDEEEYYDDNEDAHNHGISAGGTEGNSSSLLTPDCTTNLLDVERYSDEETIKDIKINSNSVPSSKTDEQLRSNTSISRSRLTYSEGYRKLKTSNSHANTSGSKHSTITKNYYTMWRDNSILDRSPAGMIEPFDPRPGRSNKPLTKEFPINEKVNTGQSEFSSQTKRKMLLFLRFDLPKKKNIESEIPKEKTGEKGENETINTVSESPQKYCEIWLANPGDCIFKYIRKLLSHYQLYAEPSEAEIKHCEVVFTLVYRLVDCDSFNRNGISKSIIDYPPSEILKSDSEKDIEKPILTKYDLIRVQDSSERRAINQLLVLLSLLGGDTKVNETQDSASSHFVHNTSFGDSRLSEADMRAIRSVNMLSAFDNTLVGDGDENFDASNDDVCGKSVAPRSRFLSRKLTKKLQQQMLDPLALTTGALPDWCWSVASCCPQLLPMETGTLPLFRATAFGPARAIAWYQANRRRRLPGMGDEFSVVGLGSGSTGSVVAVSGSGLGSGPVSTTGMVGSVSSVMSGVSSGGSSMNDLQLLLHDYLGWRLQREVVRVAREPPEKFWHDAGLVLTRHAERKEELEVQYSDEQGTGLGPTLEFFHLMALEFCSINRNMWLNSTSEFPVDEKGQTTQKLVNAPRGLFPIPMLPSMAKESGILENFHLLGIAIAKCLQDSRRMDIPFSTAFLKLLCSNPDRENWLSGVLELKDLCEVYPELGLFLKKIEKLCLLKRQVEESSSQSEDYESVNVIFLEKPEEILEKEAYELFNCSVSDLHLDMEFLLPNNFNEIKSKPIILKDEYEWENSNLEKDTNFTNDLESPESLTLNNIDVYLKRICDFCLDKGIRAQMNAFRDGFCRVFDISSVGLFNPEDFRRILCGDSTGLEWTREELLMYTEPGRGYTRDSATFQMLLDVLIELDLEQRRAFLQFATGSASLPPGGLRNLAPRLQVVRKEEDGGPYPSVNTCLHYLKLPEYSNKSDLKIRLLEATRETGFYLN